MQFGFVTVIPKYLNSATISKDLLTLTLFMYWKKSYINCHLSWKHWWPSV